MNIEFYAYKTWAPPEALWSPWVKPVLFSPDASACLKKSESKPIKPQGQGSAIGQVSSKNQVSGSTAQAGWLSTKNSRTAIIIDLPGESGVEEGLAVARLGYRPVPLYNGVGHESHQFIAVPVDGIVSALFYGAEALARLDLRPESPPAFLLDSNRMRTAGRGQGIFDNRWCVFAQDMPSALFLLGQGYEQVLVRSDRIQDDLAHILYRYQQSGLKIKLFDSRTIKDINIAKPSKFKNLMYRFSVILGLARHPGGGFGGNIPLADESGSSHRGIG